MMGWTPILRRGRRRRKINAIRPTIITIIIIIAIIISIVITIIIILVVIIIYIILIIIIVIIICYGYHRLRVLVHLIFTPFTCTIKTGHSNLVSCFGPRMKALAKVFYRGESRGKIPCQRPNPRAKTWHKIWMTGLNLNYDTTPIPFLQNSQNKCQKSSFTYDHRRHLILPLPPVHALPNVNAPTCC